MHWTTGLAARTNQDHGCEGCTTQAPSYYGMLPSLGVAQIRCSQATPCQAQIRPADEKFRKSVVDQIDQIQPGALHNFNLIGADWGVLRAVQMSSPATTINERPVIPDNDFLGWLKKINKFTLISGHCSRRPSSSGRRLPSAHYYGCCALKG